jgi:hypothetical protein
MTILSKEEKEQIKKDRANSTSPSQKFIAPEWMSKMLTEKLIFVSKMQCNQNPS